MTQNSRSKQLRNFDIIDRTERLKQSYFGIECFRMANILLANFWCADRSINSGFLTTACLPKAILAATAIFAANVWRKQVREPHRLEVARKTIVVASKIQDQLTEARRANATRRTTAKLLLDKYEDDVKYTEVTFNIVRPFLPTDGGADLHQLNWEALELVYELRALGFEETSKVMERLRSKTQTFRFAAQMTVSHNLFQERWFLPIEEWDPSVCLEHQSEKKVEGGEAIAIVRNYEDPFAKEVAALLSDITDKMTSIIDPKK